ncbi:MAG TPA: oligoendopeptidase F [Treponemataceae bacterium]|nr:oligoendopeptidase F [Treponemataceae bacterium]
MKQTTIPKRSEVAAGDKWNLDSLFAGDAAWNEALKAFSLTPSAINAYKKAFDDDTLPLDDFAECLRAYADADRAAERIGNYASLKKSADETDSANLDMWGRFMMAVSAFSAETSWLEPAIIAMDEKKLATWIKEESKGKLEPYAIWLEKMLRMRPYVLSEREERIFALEMEASQTPHDAFSALTNADIDFGTVDAGNGPEPLSQTTFTKFLENPNRAVREDAYRKFYSGYEAHKNTIAALYAGSVNRDVANARIRGYESSRAMKLFPDRVDESVYDNLVTTVRANLGPLHRYYALRKKALGLDELRHWDVYIPLVKDVKRVTPYGEAVDLIGKALAPLGDEYVETISKGFLGGWVDRYENKGKRSGAFSSGAFDGDPYILMNYKDDVLRDVFTLAHEGGHSMHSKYSAANNPYMSYDYTIFEAEVASTFNEDLLFRHLLAQATDKKMKAYLLSTRASDILATLYRQTMFAEYEHATHALVEAGSPLTVDLLRAEYRKLLEAYFGPDMRLEDVSDLEGLRIPHFYSSFYVYKYATGISASLALAERVCSGGKQEREDYFKFLKSGGSRYPIDSLRVAGVDMASPAPVEAACRAFAKIVDELEVLLKE